MKPLNKIILTDIENVLTVSSPKGRNERITNRPWHGLSFCESGQITYTHKGNKIISDRNHAVFLPYMESYELHGDKAGIFPVINFMCTERICDTVTAIPIKDIETYLKDYEQIKALFLFERNRAKVMSIFYNILHRMHIHSEHYCDIIVPAVKYIENHYSDAELSNEILAKQCNISEVYFRRLFTQQYGITPKQYIIDIRIQKAKHLLSDGILKVSAISEQCGFSNQYHFCRIFKDKTGLTPTEYTKENKVYKI